MSTSCFVGGAFRSQHSKCNNSDFLNRAESDRKERVHTAASTTKMKGTIKMWSLPKVTAPNVFWIYLDASPLTERFQIHENIHRWMRIFFYLSTMTYLAIILNRHPWWRRRIFWLAQVLYKQFFADQASSHRCERHFWIHVLPPFNSTCPCEFFLRVLIRCLFGHFHVDFGTSFTTTMACAFYLAPPYAE